MLRTACRAVLLASVLLCWNSSRQPRNLGLAPVSGGPMSPRPAAGRSPRVCKRTLRTSAIAGRPPLHSLLSETQRSPIRIARGSSSNSILHALGFTTRNSESIQPRKRTPEMLVDLGGASLTVHFFDEDGNHRSVVKSKQMLANLSCAECVELKNEGMRNGWVKERTPPDYAEIGYTFSDYSDRSSHSWEEVSSYLSRIIRVACRHISEKYPSAASARLTVLQTGKIRQIGDPEWEQMMRKSLQISFGSATFVEFPTPPQHALLSASDEAYFEGLMMFKYHDLSMIDINLPYGAPLLERDNALALSIGSSSTQMYTLDRKDGSLITRTNTLLGCYPPDFSVTSLQLKTGAQFALDFEMLFRSGVTKGKKYLLLVNAIGYVLKEIPALSMRINRQEPIQKELFVRECRRWLQTMRSRTHRRRDLDFELYHQLQLLSGLVSSLEKDENIKYIIVEKKGHLKPNGLQMMDERKLDYHWVTAVHKYGLSAAAVGPARVSAIVATPGLGFLERAMNQLSQFWRKRVGTFGNGGTDTA